MRHVAISGISLLLLVGCAHERPATPRPAAPTAAPQTAGSPQPPQPTAPAPAQPASEQSSAPPSPPQAAALRAGGAVGAEHAPGAASASAAGSGNAKAKAPGRGESAAAATPPTPNPGSGVRGTGAAGATVRQAPPPPPALDLASLEQRLRDTRAIGLFSKLSLKNQVDDLLAEFRAFHHGERALKLADLRQRYDLLLLKVLSLLQDGDPPLAAAISSSREAIWELLIDPQKFEKLAKT